MISLIHFFLQRFFTKLKLMSLCPQSNVRVMAFSPIQTTALPSTCVAHSARAVHAAPPSARAPSPVRPPPAAAGRPAVVCSPPDARLHDDRLHDARLHDARLHDSRLHDARLHDSRLHDARQSTGDRSRHARAPTSTRCVRAVTSWSRTPTTAGATSAA